MMKFLGKKMVSYAFKNNKRKHAFHNLNTMKSVLILFHFKDWMQIQLVAKDLERSGKQVFLWTVESREDSLVDMKIPLLMRILKSEDFSKITLLKSKAQREFKSLKYDTLIDFCKEDGEGIDYLRYLLAINTAEFCIGNRRNNEVYDLTVIQEKDKGVLETFGQMKKYLNNIFP